ncbi:zinc-binding dehydrogenase [Agrilactobacillus yilanensis]|uniref:Zinc-binding dehydrogenase n=1 Tax=Agrilactobacillus yilanensis TaxID=2485997 RepID=A0ABW4J7L5_9LACO|nr:zinc-binding dehydrogenase [Agrilactobacillus yilanensis]
MKAAVIYEPGGPKQLVVTQVPTPTVKPGWSLVKIKAFGINHSEIFTREGASPDVKFPRILGIECVGEIEDTSEATRLPVGQKVVSIMGEMGRAFDGGYAEYALLPNDQIYPVTTELAWSDLAAIPETGYTAFGSMLNLNIQATDRILVRGGTSGVGLTFMNLVKGQFPDIAIEGTTRQLAKSRELLTAGFTEVVEDQDGILQTDTTYDKIFELIGPATLRDTLKHIKERGIVCSTGELGHQWTLDQFDPIMDLPRNSYLTAFSSGDVTSEKLNDLFAYIQKYQIRLKPAKIFKLEDIQQAHLYLESQHSFGKVVIVNA